jgi:dihydrosphingosine 1-phosphate phosphatase
MVSFSGFITCALKDALGLPRPLDPVTRISAFQSLTSPYGFPSTHSANATCIGLYCYLLIQRSDITPNLPTKTVFLCLTGVYLASILLGRLYCGMHGFLDVASGATIGIVITQFEWYYGHLLSEQLSAEVLLCPILQVSLFTIIIWSYPEPSKDDIYCRDSFAFLGWLFGVELVFWHMSLPIAGHTRNLHDARYLHTCVFWMLFPIRLLIGSSMLYLWRKAMKTLLFGEIMEFCLQYMHLDILKYYPARADDKSRRLSQANTVEDRSLFDREQRVPSSNWKSGMIKQFTLYASK